MIRELLSADEVGIDLSAVEVFVCRSREEWLSMRRSFGDGLSRLGGSQAAAALGESKWLGKHGLYLELVLNIRPEREIKNVEAADILEPAIGQIYSVQANVGMLRMPRHTLLVSKRRRAFFSPDFLMAPIDERGPGIFDAKTWEGGALPKECPADYVRQLEHAFSVTGFKWGVIGILRGRTVYPYEVNFDAARVRELEEREDAFLADCDKRIEPPVDETQGTADAIDERFKDGAVSDEVVELDEEFAEKVRLLAANRKMRRDSEKTVKSLTAALKAATQSRPFRVPGREGVLTWDLQVRAAEKKPRAGYSFWQLKGLGDDDAD